MAYLQADPGRLRHPDPRSGGSPRPAPARDGRPASRPHQARALVESWTDTPLPCLSADRVYDGAAFRAWLAQRGTEAVIPARRGRTNPHDPEQCPARNAAERGLSWLKGWWRVATRYDPYAHRFLDFLYLAAAWIWLQSYLNRT